MLAGDELDRALAADASDAPIADWTAPAGGPMIYTSGTTGYPKGVIQQPGCARPSATVTRSDSRRPPTASRSGFDGTRARTW